MNTVVQILDNLDDASRGDRTDGQLLDLFVRLRDEGAFATVVRRHGPMVLGVCRRVLRNSADADDAFQAAFLVLARKAATIGTRHLLAQWLHGVAYNTARKLRQTNARRAARERPLEETSEPPAPAPDTRDELLAILDEELNQLPDRYRAVVVLCDLQGLTRREAAERLACPEGTVAGRLARARDLLAARLARRGLIPAVALLGTVLAGRAAIALPPATLAAVVHAVGVDDLAHATAKGLISPRVADTTEGVLKSMFATKLRTTVAAVLCCGLALACAAGAIHFANAQPADPRKANGAGRLPAENRALEVEKPAAVGAVEPLPKSLTVFPLKKLDPEATAKVITDAYKGKGVTVTALKDDGALLIYANEVDTEDIEALLKKLGEAPRKVASVIRPKRGTDVTDLAKNLSKRYPDATIVPVPDDGVLLAHADAVTTKQLRTYEDTGPRAGIGPVVPPTRSGEPKKYTFQFRNTNWGDVLHWYAKESGLTFVSTVTPRGTVTIGSPDERRYTLADITDLVNEALAQQKYILVRRKMTFFIHPADEKIDPDTIPRVELDELKNFGKTELVEVVLPLRALNALEVQPEVKKLLSPFGAATTLWGKSLVVQDTVGNVERILKTLEAIDKPPPVVNKPEPVMKLYALTKVKPAAASEAILKVFPRVQCLPFEAQPAVVVLAPPDVHGGITKLLRQMEESAEKARPALDPGPKPVEPATPMRFPFRFDKTPWKDVFAWYAKLSGLAASHTELPTGAFTFTPRQRAFRDSDEPLWDIDYTLDEITDAINDALVPQKWLLVRAEKAFSVIPADEKVDPKWAAQTKLDDLGRRGRTELVQVVIRAKGWRANDVLPDVKKLLGPFGTAVALGDSPLIVMDTAGNVLRIKKALDELEKK